MTDIPQPNDVPTPELRPPEASPQGMLGRLCAWLLGRFGWKVMLAVPPGPRSVIIFYPHTSNWDFIVGIVAKPVLEMAVKWVGKHTLFTWPLGPIFRSWGGIPVDRRRTKGFVGQLCDEMLAADNFHVVIAPEGTRKKTDSIKSGFYRLACQAGVPLGLAFIDYPHREIGIAKWITLSGNESQDLAVLQAHYAQYQGRRTEHHGAITFRN